MIEKMKATLTRLLYTIAISLTVGCHTHPRYQVSSVAKPYRFKLRPPIWGKNLNVRRVVFRDENSNLIWKIVVQQPTKTSELNLTYAVIPRGFKQEFPLSGKAPPPLSTFDKIGFIVIDVEDWYCRGLPLRTNGSQIEIDKATFEEYEMSKDSRIYDYFDPYHTSKMD